MKSGEELESRGFDRYVRHGTGHAHGIMIGAAGREEPGEIRVYNQRRLEPGMEEGATCLTTFPRDIHYRG